MPVTSFVSKIMLRSFIFLFLFAYCGVGQAAAYETPQSAYDRFWFRSTYPYRRSTHIRVSMPLYAGATFTNHSATSASLESKLGFAGGLGLDFYTSRRSWSLGFDLLIITKGFKTGGVDYSVSFLELPILFRAYPFENFAIQLGPYFSPVTLGARQSVGGVSTDVSSQFKGDFGFTFGVRIMKRIRYQANWGIDLRYDLGLSTIESTMEIKPKTFIAMFLLDFRL